MTKLKSPELQQKIMAALQVLVGKEPTGANMANFTSPPAPYAEIPANPCDGITFDDADHQGNVECSVSSNPQCHALQAKFLEIQIGVEDRRDDLQDELQKM
jgi:hypothetical protein